jgi:large subunit ribosomal protein L18
MSSVSKAERRLKRQSRVRKKIQGSPEMPRLCVFRSNKHVYAQIIDDTDGRTLAEASSLSKEFPSDSASLGGNKKGAALVGDAIARRALERGIKKVAFDRNGFLYHGRVKSLSEAARAAGLEF